MLPTPKERFSMKAEMHPHSLGYAGLNSYPNLHLGVETTFDPSLELVEPYGGQPPQPAFDRRLL
jgi:hypothetical protein